MVADRFIWAYICQVFGKRPSDPIDPVYNATRSYTLMEKKTLEFELEQTFYFDYDANSVDGQVKNVTVLLGKFMGKENVVAGLDLQRCHFVGVVPRTVSSTFEGPVAVGASWIHKKLRQVGEPLDNAYANVSGLPPGFSMVVEPTGGVRKHWDAPELILRPVDSGFQNTEMIKSFALASKENIDVSCIIIPKEVCERANHLSGRKDYMPVAQAGFGSPNEDFIAELKRVHPDATDVEERWKAHCEDALMRYYNVESMDQLQPDTHYVAIPFDHALAWPLRNEAFAKEKNIRMKHLMVNCGPNKEAVLMYYLVSSSVFERLKNSFGTFYEAYLDACPLREYGFKFAPILHRDDKTPAKGKQQGTIYLHFTMTFVVPRIEHKEKLIMPACSPDIPRAAAYESNDTIENFMERTMIQTSSGFMPPKVVTQ